jgi:hypothetical protein
MTRKEQTKIDRESNGHFKKGRKKTGGRQKGSLNKITQTFKTQILGFVVDNYDEFINTLNEIENPVERAKIYLKAIEYVLPKQKQIDLGGEMQISALNVEFKSNNRQPRHNENDFLDD